MVHRSPVQLQAQSFRIGIILRQPLFPEESREASEYRYGNIFTANVFWNLTPRIQAGIEFDTGVRKNWDGKSRRADRLGLMAQFSF